MSQFCKRGHDTLKYGRKGSTCSLCKKILGSKYLHKNYNRRRDHQWRYRGINCTEELYNKLLIEQNYSCAICYKNEKDFNRKLAVDHNHQTGKVRGLLCKYCNQGLVPILEYKKNLVESTIKYLEKTNG